MIKQREECSQGHWLRVSCKVWQAHNLLGVCMGLGSMQGQSPSCSFMQTLHGDEGTTALQLAFTPTSCGSAYT